jgi:hypothetical protein
LAVLWDFNGLQTSKTFKLMNDVSPNFLPLPPRRPRKLSARVVPGCLYDPLQLADKNASRNLTKVIALTFQLRLDVFYVGNLPRPGQPERAL